MDSTIYFEVFVLIDVLLGDIFGDDVVRHIAGDTAEIASRPQMPSPELLLQVGKFCQKVVRRAALQPLHQPTDRHLWRQRDQQVHMVFRYLPLHDRHVMLSADVPDQIPDPRSHLAVQRRPPVLVIHTRCKWISNTVCAPFRYSAIPKVYPARTR